MKRILLAITLAAAAALLPLPGSVLTHGRLTATSQPQVTVNAAGPNVKVNGVLMTNSKNNAPILSGTNLKPGSTVTGTVTISVVPTMTVQLTEQDVLHGGPTGSGNLAHKLQLTVFDQTTQKTVYQGALDGLTSGAAVCGNFTIPKNCPRWGALESHTFVFTVSFPNASNNSDNAYQQTSASVTFVWNGSVA